MKSRVWIALALAVMLVLAACGDSTSDTTEAEPVATTQATTAPTEPEPTTTTAAPTTTTTEPMVEVGSAELPIKVLFVPSVSAEEIIAGGELLDDYEATIDCNRGLAASVEVNAPNGPPENGVVWFSSCTVSEGSTQADAFEAHSSVAAALREMGGKAQSWLFYPSLGFGDLPFDYYSVVTFNSMSELGEGWEMYYNKGGWQKAAENEAADCDSPRVYSANAMQMGPQE